MTHRLVTSRGIDLQERDTRSRRSTTNERPLAHGPATSKPKTDDLPGAFERWPPRPSFISGYRRAPADGRSGRPAALDRSRPAVRINWPMFSLLVLVVAVLFFPFRSSSFFLSGIPLFVKHSPPFFSRRAYTSLQCVFALHTHREVSTLSFL